MHPVVAWLMGFVLVVGEAALLPWVPFEFVTPQIWLPVTVWLALQKDWPGYAVALALLCLPIEWTASGRMGLVSLGLVVVYTLIRATGLSASALNPFSLALLGAFAACVHGVVMVCALLVFDPGSRVVGAIVWTMGQSALWSALLSALLVTALVYAAERNAPRRLGGRR